MLHRNNTTGVAVLVHQQLQGFEFTFEIPLQNINIFSNAIVIHALLLPHNSLGNIDPSSHLRWLLRPL
jgi:hypothetical protein